MNGAAWLLGGLAALLVAARPASAQTVVVRCAVATVTIGEPFEVVVDIGWPASWPPPLPLAPAQLAPFLVESITDGAIPDESIPAAARPGATNPAAGDATAVRRPGAQGLRLRLRLRSYVAGEAAIGPLELQFPSANGVRTARSERRTLVVRSVLPEPAGDCEWPGDVRELPGRGAPLWWWSALALAAGLGAFWWRRRGTAVAPGVVAPNVVPNAATVPPTPDLATRLRALPLPHDRATTVAFHGAVKALLREHLQQFGHGDTQVATSEELLQRTTAPALAASLAACDGVLFAAMQPAVATVVHMRDLAAAYVAEARA